MGKDEFRGYFERDTRKLCDYLGIRQGFEVVLATTEYPAAAQRRTYEQVRSAVQANGLSLYVPHDQTEGLLMREEREILLLDEYLPRSKVVIADCDSNSLVVGSAIVRAYDSGKQLILFSNGTKSAWNVMQKLERRGRGSAVSVDHRTPEQLRSMVDGYLKHWSHQQHS